MYFYPYETAFIEGCIGEIPSAYTEGSYKKWPYETYSIPVIILKTSIRASQYKGLTWRIKVPTLHWKMSLFTFRIHNDESILEKEHEEEGFLQLLITIIHEF